MKKLFAMLFVLLIALSACGLADTEITAQGSAVLTADPDLARVSCGANVRAGSVAQAQQKVTAVTNLYNEIGIDRLAQKKIAYYFDESKKYLNALQVPEERKAELRAYAEKMMVRKY